MKNNNGMSRYPLLLLLALLLLATLPARARDGQPCRLTGRVTDARTGEAVCGAAIVVERRVCGPSRTTKGATSFRELPTGKSSCV